MSDFTQLAAQLSGPGPCADMHTSQAECNILMAREAFSATPYNLGDGGYTWGYGHQGTKNEIVPVTISKADAQTLFYSDVVNRGESVVKQYINVPLTQNQFDALVSIAFNMSPHSFRKFAAQVNAGNGIDGIAQASVAWVPAKYTNGIQNRRSAEMALYDNGVYA
jgi:lysozyme